jgi:hypothetical protein
MAFSFSVHWAVCSGGRDRRLIQQPGNPRNGRVEIFRACSFWPAAQ